MPLSTGIDRMDSSQIVLPLAFHAIFLQFSSRLFKGRINFGFTFKSIFSFIMPLLT